MNTPSNAGKEHNPDGLTPEQYDSKHYRMLRIGESVDYGDQWWDYREKNWLIVHNPNFQVDEKCAGFRRRTTPPTQSQEGETPETDALDAALRNLCKEMAADGEPMRAEDYTEIYERAIEGAKGLERRLTAAQRENDRLRKLIKDAPHERGCGVYGAGTPVRPRLPFHQCDCWKSRAATEEGKRG